MDPKKKERLRRELLERQKAGAAKSDSPKKGGFSYGKAMQDKQKGGRSEFFRFDSGITKLAFAMSTGTTSDTFYIHQKRFFIPKAGPDKKGRFVTSPRSQSEDADCLVSRVIDALNQHRSAAVRKMVDKKNDDAIGPRDRYMSNAFVLEGKRFVHKIVEYPQTVFSQTMDAVSAEIDPDDVGEGDMVADPPVVGSQRRIVSVNKEGKGKLGTKYTVSVTAKKADVEPEELKKVVDLSRYNEPTPEAEVTEYLQQFLKTDDLEEVLSGEWNPTTSAKDYEDPDVPADEEEDAEEEPAPKKKKKKQSEPEPEDEDEAEEQDADEPDDTDEEDEAPPAKKAKKKAAEEEDEEDATDDAEEEEEDDEPLPNSPPPQCFGTYDVAKKKKRGCDTCAFRSVCIDTEEE